MQWRRLFRRRRRKVEAFGQQADDHIERLLIRRINRLVSVRRFLFSWVILFAMITVVGVLQIRALSDYYLALQPVAGGVYSEGMVGSFTNANPIYATAGADNAVSRLVFSGLFKYDDQNRLVSDLAEKYELNAAETRYVVTLRKDVRWHDGQIFDADDVVFTYQSIQNIDAKSSLFASWQGIKVSRQDSYVISFDLPNPLSSFPYALTNGIVPKHILGEIPPSQLRSAPFNSSPVGTGPFRWSSIEVTGKNASDRKQRITLAAYQDYHLGAPKLAGITLRTFRDENDLIKSLQAKEIIGVAGLESLPASLNAADYQMYNTPLTSAVMVFMNNSRETLKDVRVRKALVTSVNQRQLISKLSSPAQVVDSPLLKGQLGYDSQLVQPGFDLARANAFLDQAGWRMGPGGIRQKAGKPLKLAFRSQDTANYVAASRYLQSAWRQAGIDLEVKYYSTEELQTSIIAGHDYDMLLYGISIGVDPDVFAYWHSSQASTTSLGRLNLSEYRSTAADQALEAGRTRSDPVLRAIKYRPFLEAWRNDAPALALYQPNYFYLTRDRVYGFSSAGLNSGADRFNNAHNWMIRKEKQAVQE